MHSFGLRMRDAAPLLAAGAKLTVTEHGEPFAAAVEHGAVAATQFHPEKSGDAGAAVLRNWLSATMSRRDPHSSQSRHLIRVETL